jgi:hypothetical protein
VRWLRRLYRRFRPAEDLVAEALREVNAVRVLCGLPTLLTFPRGHLASATSCPVSVALDGAWVVNPERVLANGDVSPALVEAGWEPSGETLFQNRAPFIPPAVVTRFVRAFDRGLFPEYAVGSEV